jgi:hypothetical protein
MRVSTFTTSLHHPHTVKWQGQSKKVESKDNNVVVVVVVWSNVIYVWFGGLHG